MLRTFLRSILFLCLGFVSCNCFSATATQDLVSLLNNIKTLQANFVQTVVDANERVLQQTKGEMSLQRPGKFRWKIISPSKQLLIADGSRVWFYDVDLSQVTVQKQQTVNAGAPALLLSGSAQRLVQDYVITARIDNDQQIFQLQPKAKNNLFQMVELIFRNHQLQAMRLHDGLKQTTVVKFSDVQSNLSLNASLFQFTPPHGVDVVSQ